MRGINLTRPRDGSFSSVWSRGTGGLESRGHAEGMPAQKAELLSTTTPLGRVNSLSLGKHREWQREEAEESLWKPGHPGGTLACGKGTPEGGWMVLDMK